MAPLYVNGTLIPETVEDGLRVNNTVIDEVYANGVRVWHNAIPLLGFSNSSTATQDGVKMEFIVTNGNQFQIRTNANNARVITMSTDGTLSGLQNPTCQTGFGKPAVLLKEDSPDGPSSYKLRKEGYPTSVTGQVTSCTPSSAFTYGTFKFNFEARTVTSAGFSYTATINFITRTAWIEFDGGRFRCVSGSLGSNTYGAWVYLL